MSSPMRPPPTPTRSDARTPRRVHRSPNATPSPSANNRQNASVTPSKSGQKMFSYFIQLFNNTNIGYFIATYKFI